MVMHICFMSFTKNYCISPSLSAGVDNFQSQILKRREVKCMPGGHKEFLLCSLSKRLCKVKYAFEGLVSNVYLGFSQTTN